MPTSYYTQIPAVIEAIIEAQPQSILDIGVGCGKWGVLSREYLEVWDRYFEPWGSHKIKVDGVEIHELYKDSPAWAAYDTVTIGDIRDIAPALDHYDAMLLIDVLEHFELSEGTDLLNELIMHTDCIIVAIPTVFAHTVEVWNNPHEIHKCAWTYDDFEEIGQTTWYRNEDSMVVAIRPR